MEYKRNKGEKLCPLHYEEVKFQCIERNCDHSLICEICITKEHSGHKTYLIKDDDIVCRKRSILSYFIEEFELKKKDLLTHHKTLKLIKVENEEKFSNAQKQIQEHFEQLTYKMERMKKELMERSELCYTQNNKEINTCSNQLAEEIVDCTGKIDTLNTTKMSDDHVMIFDTVRELTILQYDETPWLSITDEIIREQRQQVEREAFPILIVPGEWQPYDASSAQAVEENYRDYQHEDTRTPSDRSSSTLETSFYEEDFSYSIDEDNFWASSPQTRQINDHKHSAHTHGDTREIAKNFDRDLTLESAVQSPNLSFGNMTPDTTVPSTSGGSVSEENSSDICKCSTILYQYEYQADINSIVPCQNKIWVSSKSSNEIKLLSDSGDVIQKVEGEQMIFDISVSPSTQNLWFCDSFAVKEVIIEQNASIPIIKFSSDFTPTHLCMTSEDDIILADDTKLGVYSTSGSILHPQGDQSQKIVANPLHIAVCPNTGNIAVANSDMEHFGGKDKPHVVIASEKLEVKRRFYGPGIKYKKASTDTFYPTDIVYNSSGQLIIADSANTDVLLVQGYNCTLIATLHRDQNQFPAIGLSENEYLYVCASPHYNCKLSKLSNPGLQTDKKITYIKKLQYR